MLYLVVGVIAALAAFSYFSDSGDRNGSPPRPSSPPSYEPAQAPVLRLDERQERQYQSQRDYTPIVEDPASLRAKAHREGDLMTQCFQQSHEAYERRDHALAKALAVEGKRHKLEVENLNTLASAAIFKENNQDRPAGEVDLHGLHKKEALAYSERAIEEARQRGNSEIRLIVGRGNHSDGNVSILKPALQEFLQNREIPVEVDSRNPGVLLVRVDGSWQ